MAHRIILTERQRSALFDLPTDEAALLRHYTLADEDLEIIRIRRRPHNRFGFTLQLKWPQKTGQSAKVYPKPLKGYVNGKGPELYRSV